LSAEHVDQFAIKKESRPLFYLNAINLPIVQLKDINNRLPAGTRAFSGRAGVTPAA